MRQKSGMADREREEREYRETYGRGGGETFEDRDHPQSYAAAGAPDWRQALRAYVDGHDRGWEAERKQEAAAAATEREPGAAPTTAGAGDGAAGEAGEATARTEEGTPFGITVPDRERLAFHRSASIWRDRLPDARRLPRHTDRRLDTAPGRGGQA